MCENHQVLNIVTQFLCCGSVCMFSTLHTCVVQVLHAIAQAYCRREQGARKSYVSYCMVVYVYSYTLHVCVVQALRMISRR